MPGRREDFIFFKVGKFVAGKALRLLFLNAGKNILEEVKLLSRYIGKIFLYIIFLRGDVPNMFK